MHRKLFILFMFAMMYVLQFFIWQGNTTVVLSLLSGLVLGYGFVFIELHMPHIKTSRGKARGRNLPLPRPVTAPADPPLIEQETNKENIEFTREVFKQMAKEKEGVSKEM